MLPYGRIVVGEVNLRVSMSNVNTLIFLFALYIVKSATSNAPELSHIFYNAALHMQIVNDLCYKVMHFLSDSQQPPLGSSK